MRGLFVQYWDWRCSLIAVFARQLSRDGTPGGGVTKLINKAINNYRNAMQVEFEEKWSTVFSPDSWPRSN